VLLSEGDPVPRVDQLRADANLLIGASVRKSLLDGVRQCERCDSDIATEPTFKLIGTGAAESS